MSNLDQHVVIVGAGLAGARTAVTLRERGHRGAITLVGDEPAAPYERPGLSKDYLTGAKTADDLLVVPTSWYDEQGVTRLEGVAAEGLDLAARHVLLAGGQELTYDSLVLATGAEPRRLDIPGAEHALTLRRIGDSDRLRAAFTTASSLVVVGGGWIGLEVAAAARGAGVDTTVLERMPLPLAHVLGPELGAYLADLHRRHGVALHTGTAIGSITGGDRLAVETDAGSFAADLVLMGVGAAPNVALAESAGLAVDNGVTVDELLRTSHPDVYAIGDVANARNTALGTSLRVEHWDNAIRQGRAVAATILGEDTPYDWQPYFYTDQFDFGMEYVGHGDASDELVVRGDLGDGEFLAFWLREGRVSAAMNVNIWDVNDQLRALVGRSVEPRLLADPDVDLTELG